MIDPTFEAIASAIGLVATGAGLGYFTRKVVVGGSDDPDCSSRLDARTKELDQAKKELQRCSEDRSEFQQRLTKYEGIREALLADEEELWRLHPETPPPQYLERLTNARAKIITVGSNKGGVGKTTLVANLAAYFEQKRHLRVLAIDLDYQGSLSATLLRAAGLLPGLEQTTVGRLLSDEAEPTTVIDLAQTLQPVLPKAAVLTASYTLNSIENRMMLRWLLEETEKDIRYRLADLLLSDPVQQAYDVIILDTPPRWTTAAINALTASHYLLVPTVPDRMSGAAVGRFLSQVRDLRGRLFPALAFAGVVVNLSRVNNLSEQEIDALRDVRRDLEALNFRPTIFERNIPRMVALSGAAEEHVAYVDNRNFREGIMDNLGDEIAEFVGL